MFTTPPSLLRRAGPTALLIAGLALLFACNDDAPPQSGATSTEATEGGNNATIVPIEPECDAIVAGALGAIDDEVTLATFGPCGYLAYRRTETHALYVREPDLEPPGRLLADQVINYAFDPADTRLVFLTDADPFQEGPWSLNIEALGTQGRVELEVEANSKYGFAVGRDGASILYLCEGERLHVIDAAGERSTIDDDVMCRERPLFASNAPVAAYTGAERDLKIADLESGLVQDITTFRHSDDTEVFFAHGFWISNDARVLTHTEQRTSNCIGTCDEAYRIEVFDIGGQPRRVHDLRLNDWSEIFYEGSSSSSASAASPSGGT